MNTCPTHNTTDLEPAITTPKTFMLDHFWRGMIERKFRPRTPEEIEQLLDDVHCKQVPLLTALTPEEEAFFKNAIRRTITQNINRQSEYDPKGIFKEICENIMAATRDRIAEQIAEETLYCLSSSELEKANACRPFEEGKLQALTLNEKIAYFSRPEIWEHVGYEVHAEDAKKRDGAWYGIRYQRRKLSSWGYRSLKEYMSPKRFESLVEETKKRTGKTHLLILDIGGGMGKAIKEARARYPELEGINLTMTEEPVMYEDEGMRHMYGSVERMPQFMREKCDIIISNMALRYMLLPDVGYFNIVDALSVGGEAYVTTETNRELNGLPMAIIMQRVKRAFEILHHLNDIGAIELTCRTPKLLCDPEGHRPFDPTYRGFCPFGTMRIIKKRAIDMGQYERITKIA